MTKIALDTNILIYSHDKTDVRKQGIARTLLGLSPVISTQVISEYINVLRHKIKMSISKYELIELCIGNLEDCVIQPVDMSTLRNAGHIIQRYGFQIFDSIIVASVLAGGCQVLYSEDMQHNQIIEGKLTIINPFI